MDVIEESHLRPSEISTSAQMHCSHHHRIQLPPPTYPYGVLALPHSGDIPTQEIVSRLWTRKRTTMRSRDTRGLRRRRARQLHSRSWPPFARVDGIDDIPNAFDRRRMHAMIPGDGERPGTRPACAPSQGNVSAAS